MVYLRIQTIKYIGCDVFMKKIYISAYCNTNVGDDMFVLTLVRRYPDIKFYLFAHPDHSAAFLNERNLWVPSRIWFFVFRILSKLGLSSVKKVHESFARRCDAVVKIGGSVFIEPENFCIDDASNDYDFGRIYYLGANFGPYRHEEYFDYIKSRLSGSKDCCFRDRYSADKFNSLGNVRYAPDILFGCDFLPTEHRGTGVGISVISFDNRDKLNRYADKYYTMLADFSSLCISRHIPVTLFSFCKSEGDEKAIDEILKRVREDVGAYVSKVLYRGDLQSFSDELNKCDCLLATRFHAMVLGFCMNKRVLPIIYSNKQTNVLEDIGFDGTVLDVLNGEFMTSEELLAACSKLKVFDVRRLSAESVEQFAKLDKYLCD